MRRLGESTSQKRLRRRLVRAREPVPCGLCHELINVLLPASHPLSLELDHILERHKGGPDTESNLRAAHKVCNRQRERERRRGQTEFPSAGCSINW